MPTGLGLQAVIGCAALAAVCTVLDHGSGGAAGGYAASTIGVGRAVRLAEERGWL